MSPRPSLVTLAWVFARLGFTAFGGPAAHVAKMEQIFVTKEAWVAPERFRELFAVASLLPGPSSTELAIFLGRELGGGVGLVLAGVGFILPGVALTAIAAAAYQRFGGLGVLAGALAGAKPVVVAILAHAAYTLAKRSPRTGSWWAIVAATPVAAVLGAPAWLALIAGGAARGALAWARDRRSTPPVAALFAFALPARAIELFAVFAKLGFTLFGSGYAIVALMRAELVEGRALVTDAQLADAAAIGQLTPGPVFSTATFLGWLVDGPRGAALATLGIFAPAFVLVAVSALVVDRLRASTVARAFLEGVNAASIGLIVLAGALLGRATIASPIGVGLALAALAALVRRVGSGPVLLVACAIGAALGLR